VFHLIVGQQMRQDRLEKTKRKSPEQTSCRPRGEEITQRLAAFSFDPRNELVTDPPPSHLIAPFPQLYPMPHADTFLSRRRLLIRQKGYQNLNVISLDCVVLYPRSSHTRSPSFRRARGIEEAPAMPPSLTHCFGLRQQQDIHHVFDTTEEHQSVKTAVVVGAATAASTSNQWTASNGEFFGKKKDQITLPSLLTSEITGLRKLPIAPNLNADDDVSIPGATWQRAPRLPYSYTARGLDTPPNLPPHIAVTTATTPTPTYKPQQPQQHLKANKIAAAATSTTAASVITGASRRSNSNSHRLIDPTESVRRGYGFSHHHHYNNSSNSRPSAAQQHQQQQETASFCHSYSGSSLSSHETRYYGYSGNGRPVRLEFPSPSMRSLNSWYNRCYTYNDEVAAAEDDEEEEEDGDYPEENRFCSTNNNGQPLSHWMVEEPDFYREEEETQDAEDDDLLDDRMAPPLQELEDSGSSSRGTDSSSSSGRGGAAAGAAATDSSSTTLVDIGDGTLLRLRGADETWRAVTNDFYAPAVCTCCESTLFCIQDAGTFFVVVFSANTHPILNKNKTSNRFIVYRLFCRLLYLPRMPSDQSTE
jgi:hypothetical protein